MYSTDMPDKTRIHTSRVVDILGKNFLLGVTTM